MARWTDLCPWIGPSPNRTAGGMQADVRGVVVHIASGSFDGTIAWQRNPDANVSSHFIVARDGRIVQMVDTADASWAQKAGNYTWLSIENEGRTPGDPGYQPGLERLTDAQVDANARILARAHRQYGAGVPLQLATSPSGRGLGHHSMGAESGVDWGHSQCPGEVIKSQKPAILARAIAITNGDDVNLTDQVPDTGTPATKGANRNVGNVLHDQQQKRSIEIGELPLSTYPADSPYRKLLEAPAALAARLDAIEAKLAAATPVELTAEQASAMADRIAAALVARPDNPLGDADKPLIVAAVKQALAEGVGA